MFVIYKDSKVYYKRKGKSPMPILFLHGWGGSTKSFEFLSRDGDILIDFPPFGKSQEPKIEYSLDDYVNIVLLVLKTEKVEKVNIVAHSFGGRVAIELASKYNVVNKMLLTSSAGLKPKFCVKKYLCQIRYKHIKEKVQKGTLDKSALDSFGSKDYKNLSPIMKKTFVKIVNYYQNDMLKNIKCDTLLVWGRFDKETPLYMAKTLKRHIKNSELIVYPSGHFCYLENSFAFGQIINNFLRKEI